MADNILLLAEKNSYIFFVNDRGKYLNVMKMFFFNITINIYFYNSLYICFISLCFVGSIATSCVECAAHL